MSFYSLLDHIICADESAIHDRHTQFLISHFITKGQFYAFPLTPLLFGQWVTVHSAGVLEVSRCAANYTLTSQTRNIFVNWKKASFMSPQFVSIRCSLCCTLSFTENLYISVPLHVEETWLEAKGLDLGSVQLYWQIPPPTETKTRRWVQCNWDHMWSHFPHLLIAEEWNSAQESKLNKVIKSPNCKGFSQEIIAEMVWWCLWIPYLAILSK